MNTASDLGLVAVTAAERGWYVFPLRPGTKRPAFPDHTAERCSRRDRRCTDGHVGWEARATRDPDRIRRAWTTKPYNVGIACGPSRLVVIDLDTPKPGTTLPDDLVSQGATTGYDVFVLVCDQASQPVPVDTHTVTTGRNGTHLYYTHPNGPQLRNTTGATPGSLGPLIDTRSHGGYIVAAGSTVNHHTYTTTWDTPPAPLPDWLTQRLTPTPLPPQQPVTVHVGTGRRGSYLDTAINASTTAISTAPAGTLNRTLYGAAVALGQLIAGGALNEHDTEAALLAAAITAGHPAGPAHRTIRSGFRAGAQRPRTVAA
jgi:hypothetical protein